MVSISSKLEDSASVGSVAIFRRSRDLTLSELSRWLGITEGEMMALECTAMSRITALALAAIDRGLKPWFPTEDDRALG